MADEEECDCPECPKGLPAYLATFADLMSLLMCFFVLLLAFSEMDVQKYKQVAGSMKDAFGVQDKIKMKEMPKGTSIIAQEFSPGRPDPTPLNEVRQSTTETMQNTLDVLCAPGRSEQREDAKDQSTSSSDHSAEILERLVSMTQADAVEVAARLKQDIQSGAVEVETRNRRIVIRVKEKGSFPSGSATLRPDFLPIMEKIRGAIKNIEGIYSVEGHTDDLPIATTRFRSNWELSSSRAVSVAQELMKDGAMDPAKFTVKGYADTQPMVPNENEENRARNRRVEIVIEQGTEDEKYLSGEEPLPEDPEFNAALLREAGIENLEGFDLLPADTPQDDAEPQDVISVLEPATEADPEAPAESPDDGAPAASPFDLTVDPFAPRPAPDQEDEFF
ncbi:MAG: type VI secretion system protein TssL [Pseudomonadales bacterium]|nr:type VI secretion system protein TssL [Pseudomonadales bacterium]